MRNPNLREEPRFEKAAVLPLTEREGILEWLQSKGRVVARQNVEVPQLDEGEDEYGLLDEEDAEDVVDVDED
jgi:Protein of unknown function (DUF3134)